MSQLKPRGFDLIVMGSGPPAACKVFVEEETGPILGVHLLVKTTIWAYPTNGSDTACMV
jgi:hypothetical protein